GASPCESRASPSAKLELADIVMISAFLCLKFIKVSDYAQAKCPLSLKYGVKARLALA
ncbi:MAG: hypothetical protein ACI935_003317, partial [Moritella dasanensis]